MKSLNAPAQATLSVEVDAALLRDIDRFLREISTAGASDLDPAELRGRLRKRLTRAWQKTNSQN